MIPLVLFGPKLRLTLIHLDPEIVKLGENVTFTDQWSTELLPRLVGLKGKNKDDLMKSMKRRNTRLYMIWMLSSSRETRNYSRTSPRKCNLSRVGSIQHLPNMLHVLEPGIKIR